MWIVIGVLFIVAWPISKLLDWILGKDHHDYYRRTELKELLGLHSFSSRKKNMEEEDEGMELQEKQADENWLTDEEVLIIKGALDMQEKIVLNVQVPLKDVYTISTDTIIDEEKRKHLYEYGYSRIPSEFHFFSIL